jgi:hypothetical protein
MPLRHGAALALLALVLYGGFKAAPLLMGPTLTLSSPSDGQAFPTGLVTVAGVARHTENLKLDGAPLLIDEQGRFSTSLDLPSGGAILSMTVTDRFGRSHSLKRSVYVPY